MRTQRPQLPISERESGGKAALGELRRSGIVPASLFGGHQEPQNVQVEAKALNEYLLHHGTGAILNLAFGGKGTPALVKHVDRNPTNGAILHAEFQRVVLSEELKTSVPIHFVGEEALTDRGLVMSAQVHTLDIHGRADQLPEAVTVDVSGLDSHSVIHAGDIPLPKGVELSKNADLPVVSATLAGSGLAEDEPLEVAAGETAEVDEAGAEAGESEGENSEEAAGE